MSNLYWFEDWQAMAGRLTALSPGASVTVSLRNGQQLTGTITKPDPTANGRPLWAVTDDTTTWSFGVADVAALGVPKAGG
jgi:hypothetical protein